MRVSAGDWCYSLNHDEPGRVIAVDVIWGEETAQVWLARRDVVGRLHRAKQRAQLETAPSDGEPRMTVASSQDDRPATRASGGTAGSAASKLLEAKKKKRDD